MTFRRTILVVLLFVLATLLIYNSYIAPLFFRGYTEMGMGMHGRMSQQYSSMNSLIDFNIILLIALGIAAIFLYDILSPVKQMRRCRRCGHSIDDTRWKICPLCGSSINEKRGDRW